jgi:hypothetical protein
MTRLVFGSPQANRLLQRDKRVAAYVAEHGVDPDDKLRELRATLRDSRIEKERTTNADDLQMVREDIWRTLEALWAIEAQLGDRLTDSHWDDRT